MPESVMNKPSKGIHLPKYQNLLKECKNLKLRTVAKPENKIKYIEGISNTLDEKMKEEKSKILERNPNILASHFRPNASPFNKRYPSRGT